MDWLQIQVTVDPRLAEAVACVLENLDALSVTYTDAADQPLFEPDLGTTPLWDQTRVVGLFPKEANGESLRQELAAQLELATDRFELEPLAEQNWIESWRSHFRSGPIGKQLWIAASDEVPPTDRTAIILNPGLAFGAGSHPTTRLCLSWLDERYGAGELDGRRVIDFGCGSGILAIAAAKLGAGNILAIDHDPQALTATLDNAKSNGVSKHIATCLPGQWPAEWINCHGKVDLLLANILANPLIELIEHFAELLRPGGLIVLSGILESQGEAIIQTYSSAFSDLHTEVEDGWLGISGRRR